MSRDRFFSITVLGFLGIIESGCFISGKNRVRAVQNTSIHHTASEDIVQGELSFGGTSSAFIDKNSIDAMIYQGLPDIQACYQRELKCAWRNPPEGKIVIRFTITAEGSIKNVGVESSTLNSLDMEDCLIQVFKGFEYNNLTKAEVTLSYPFLFQME